MYREKTGEVEQQLDKKVMLSSGNKWKLGNWDFISIIWKLLCDIHFHQTAIIS